jgi:hypothetical protein
VRDSALNGASPHTLSLDLYAMDKEPIYERILGSIASFSEDFLELKQFDFVPWEIRNIVSKIFWISHVLFLGIALIEGKLLNSSDMYWTERAIIFPAFCWGVYFVNFFFVFLPFNGTFALYQYLVDKKLPRVHAILISLLTIIGVIAIFIFIRVWAS